MFYVQGTSTNVYCSSSVCLMLSSHISSCIGLHISTAVCVFTLHVYSIASAAAEVTLSSLTLASRTATTLSVTWSAGYPKCYSFTVSHSTQDGSVNVTQPANSDTSHTLTSLKPDTTYKIEVEAVRKEDGADGQRAKVVGIYTTDGPGTYVVLTLLAIVSYYKDDYIWLAELVRCTW